MPAVPILPDSLAKSRAPTSVWAVRMAAIAMSGRFTLITKAWTDTGYGDFSVYASYTHERMTDTGGDVASVANSVYTDRASINFNDPEVGTSDYQREHRFTLDIDATEHFVDDLASNFDFYIQRLSGQPYSLVYTGDQFGPFSTAGVNNGGTTNKSVVYVPALDPTTHSRDGHVGIRA